MRTLIFIVLLFVPQILCAELVYFDILKIDGLQLISASDSYELAESCTIKNKYGGNISSFNIQLPASAKGYIEFNGDRKILDWVVLIDDKNNKVIPE